MAVKYKVVKTATPGIKGGGSYSYYPRVCARTKTDLAGIARRISEKCTLKPPDIHGVLVALTDELPALLLENNTIQLGYFGTFSLHASGKPSGSPEEVNETKITGLKVAFRPGKMIKHQLHAVRFKQI
jgi:predicted histone-like DNA-binding protein